MKMIKKGESYMRSDARAARTLTLSIFAAIMAFLSTVVFPSSTHAATATALSTGTTHTCVVVDRKAKCWGDNTAGKLGNSSTAATTTPVAAYTKAPWSEQVDVCDSWFIVCTKSHKETVQHAGSALYGKSVTKISAGDTHTCAVANARVYCWGDNSDGQLGNRSTSDSSVPVAVDITGNSALLGKEVIDISAGYYFTCALASDGTVACWGRNGNGQLGNDTRDNKNYPVAVSVGGMISGSSIAKTCLKYQQIVSGIIGYCIEYDNPKDIPSSALIGKKVKKLAVLKGEAATMCAITREDSVVCWGQNYAGQVGAGTSSSSPVKGSGSNNSGGSNACDSTLGRAAMYARENSNLRYYLNGGDSLRPLAVRTNEKFENLTIVAGRSGYSDAWLEDEGIDIDLSIPHPTPLIPGNVSGGQWAYRDFSGLAWSIVTGTTTNQNRGYWWGGSRLYEVHAGCKRSTQNKPGSGVSKYTDITIEITHTYNPQPLPAGPLYTGQNTPLTNQRLSPFSGYGYPSTNYGGTFCALRSVPNSAYCDLHGASALDQGQAGNNYTAQCTSTKDGWGVTTTTCTPDPTGPQPVYTAGWLSGKTITAIDTGFADRAATHTCVIASGKVACWGSNTKGQLGVGDTTLRKQPTGVSL